MKTFRVIFAFWLSIAICISIVRFPFLPDVVAIHWGIDGNPDAYGSKWINILMAPAVLALTWGIFEATLRYTSDSSRKSVEDGYKWIGLGLGIVFVSLQAVLLFRPVTIGEPTTDGSLKTLFPGIISALLVFMGLGIRNLKPNPWAGIRVSWTLSNPEVWRITHQRASKLWVTTGLAGIVLSVFGAPFWFPLSLFLVVSLYPILDAYLVHKQVTGGTSAS